MDKRFAIPGRSPYLECPVCVKETGPDLGWSSHEHGRLLPIYAGDSGQIIQLGCNRCSLLFAVCEPYRSQSVPEILGEQLETFINIPSTILVPPTECKNCYNPSLVKACFPLTSLLYPTDDDHVAAKNVRKTDFIYCPVCCSVVWKESRA